jgi:hypothetical protein
MLLRNNLTDIVLRFRCKINKLRDLRIRAN